MAIKDTPKLYYDVVDITYDFLGPAADRFIDRQIRNHLRKNPERINSHDLAGLIDWLRVAMAILTDDDKLVNDYVRQLRKLLKGIPT